MANKTLNKEGDCPGAFAPGCLRAFPGRIIQFSSSARQTPAERT